MTTLSGSDDFTQGLPADQAAHLTVVWAELDAPDSSKKIVGSVGRKAGEQRKHRRLRRTEDLGERAALATVEAVYCVAGLMRRGRRFPTTSAVRRTVIRLAVEAVVAGDGSRELRTSELPDDLEEGDTPRCLSLEEKFVPGARPLAYAIDRLRHLPLDGVAATLGQEYRVRVTPEKLAVELAKALRYGRRHAALRPDKEAARDLQKEWAPMLEPGIRSFFAKHGVRGMRLTVLVDVALGLPSTITARKIRRGPDTVRVIRHQLRKLPIVQKHFPAEPVAPSL